MIDRDPDKEQWALFMRERVERTRGKGTRRPSSLVDFHLARVRKVKRLVNRALKELGALEKDLVKLRKEL